MHVHPFSFPQYATLQENEQLAGKIIAACPEEKEGLERICSGNFMVNPTAHLINEMIKRGVGRSSPSDSIRAFVTSEIPGFMDSIQSVDFLKTFAMCYFKENSNYEKIMAVFEKSLKSNAFKKALKDGVSIYKGSFFQKGDRYLGEAALRVALAIYPQAENLNEFHVSSFAHQERAEKR